VPDSGIAIWQANSAIDMAMARGLFREYQQQLGIDLQFQAFDQELASLPGAYGAPRGALLLAARDGVPVGCGALRALDETRAEMKRLYVRPDARGSGAGVLLVEALVREGERLGYTQLVLDTLPSMAVAHRLYERCGFAEIAPYHDGALPGTRFYGRTLRR